MDTVLNRRAVDKGSSVESDKITKNPPEVVGNPRGWAFTVPKYDKGRELLRDVRLQIMDRLEDWAGERDAEGKPRLTRSARHVLRVIVKAGDAPERGEGVGVVVRNTWLMRSTIGDRAGYSTKTVDRALAELHLAGLIAWKRSGRANRYLVFIPDEVIEAATGQARDPSGESESPGGSGSMSHPMGHGDAHTKTKTPSSSYTTPHQPQPQGTIDDEPTPPSDDNPNPGGGGDGGEILRILIQAGVKKPKAQAIADSGRVTVAQLNQLVEKMRARSDISNPPAWLAWACKDPDGALAMEPRRHMSAGARLNALGVPYDIGDIKRTDPEKAKREIAAKIEDAKRPGFCVPDNQLRDAEKLRDILAQMRDDGKLREAVLFTLQTLRAKGYGYAELIDPEAWHERRELVYRVDPLDGTPEGNRFAAILLRGVVQMEKRAERRPAQTLTINPG